MRAAPTLETARLRLRPFRAADLDAQAATMADPDVVRHLGGSPFSREDTWRRLLTGPGMWAFFGFGYWAVERREDGAWLGQVGFADFKRDMQPSIEGLPEMGWIFAPSAQGQGYAREAVAAGLAWADETLKAPEIVAIIDHANTASIRLAERCGFNERTDATYRGAPILLVRRPMPARN
ncbi:MAG TPA: GNAT family N-acetyltransferase [Allosphingosinicella sp.]|nr:GNAT family N-acetyltransferase [Allosphingosinicella sp.]